MINKVKELLTLDPNIGRYSVMRILGVKEHEARALLEEARGQAPKNLIPIISVAVFDLETSGLRPGFDGILCGSVYSYPEGRMESFRIDDYIKSGETFDDDGRIAVAIRDLLEKHHILIGWYSKGFDVSFLNTRLVKAGERKMQPRLHLDPIWYYKGWRGLKPNSSRMKSVAQFYGLDEQKMDIPAAVFAKAGAGDNEALGRIVERCESDVRVTAELTRRTLDAGLVKNIQTYG